MARAQPLAGAAFVAVVALAACDQPSPPPLEPPPVAAAAAPSPPAARLADVQWPPPDTLDHATRAALPAAAVTAVDTSQVPVLVPPRPDLLPAAVVVAKAHWTSFWGRTPAITVSVMATRLAHKYDHIPPMRGPAEVRGRPGWVTQNEGIWSATWTENGVVYTLDLECASPADAACASDALLLQIAGELAYVGGVGARRGQGGQP